MQCSLLLGLEDYAKWLYNFKREDILIEKEDLKESYFKKE